MGTTMKNARTAESEKRGRQRGVTLIEVMISAGFLSVALMGAALTMATGISSVLISQEQLLAKQKAREAIESVFTVRNTQNLTFDQIQNVANGGIFLDGFQQLRQAGVDGIANTADDAAANVETLTTTGPDGLLGTADDVLRTLTTFQRSITLTDILLANNTVDPDVRQIQVEVRYTLRGVWRTIMISSMISRFS